MPRSAAGTFFRVPALASIPCGRLLPFHEKGVRGAPDCSGIPRPFFPRPPRREPDTIQGLIARERAMSHGGSPESEGIDLERSLSLLRATLESTADGVLVVDHHGVV